MTRDELLRDVIRIVSGLQVPISLGMELGTARDPWRRLKAELESFGWMKVDGEDEYVAKLAAIVDREVAHT